MSPTSSATWLIPMRRARASVMTTDLPSTRAPATTGRASKLPRTMTDAVRELSPTPVAEQRTAVIDMGSNSFRLVVFTAADGWWKRTDEISLAVRIGEGLDATGKLGKAPMKRALEAADVFAHFCKATRITGQEIQAVATSAIRDASNQAVFLE